MFIFVRVNMLMFSLVIFNLTILAHQHKQGEHQEEQEVNCSLIQLFLFQTGRVGEMTYGTVQTCHLVLFVLLLIRYQLRTKNVYLLYHLTLTLTMKCLKCYFKKLVPSFVSG